MDSRTASNKGRTPTEDREEKMRRKDRAQQKRKEYGAAKKGRRKG